MRRFGGAEIGCLRAVSTLLKRIFSQTKKVPFTIRFRDFAAQDITIKLTNAVSILSRNHNRRMASKNYLFDNNSLYSALVK